ncbi:MAG: hydrogenase assembly protein HypC [Clostridiales bacterium 43-6]|nr:MAG: hydrogenase assembly protein HypC [Clostridiales bacterium 43-6]
MCIATAGLVMSMDGDNAKVLVGGNILTINISLVNPTVGDYVLLHAGCAIEIIKEDSAKELMDIHKELEGLMNDHA